MDRSRSKNTSPPLKSFQMCLSQSQVRRRWCTNTYKCRFLSLYLNNSGYVFTTNADFWICWLKHSRENSSSFTPKIKPNFSLFPWWLVGVQLLKSHTLLRSPVRNFYSKHINRICISLLRPHWIDLWLKFRFSCLGLSHIWCNKIKIACWWWYNSNNIRQLQSWAFFPFRWLRGKHQFEFGSWLITWFITFSCASVSFLER